MATNQQQEQPFEQQQQTPESQTKAWEGIAAEAYDFGSDSSSNSGSDNNSSKDKSSSPSDTAKKITENNVDELDFNDPFAEANVSFYSRSSAPGSSDSRVAGVGQGGDAGGRPPLTGDSSLRSGSSERPGSSQVTDAIAQLRANPAQSWADAVSSYLQNESTNLDPNRRLAEAVENSRSLAEFAKENGGLSQINWTGLPGSQPAYTMMGKGDQAVTLAPLSNGNIAIDNGKTLSLYTMSGGRAVSALEFPAQGNPTVKNLNPNDAVPGMPSLSSFRETARELENLARIHAEFTDPSRGDKQTPEAKENQAVQEAVNPIAARLMHASLELRRMEQAPSAKEESPKEQLKRLGEQINFFESVNSPEHFQPLMEQHLQISDKNGASKVQTMGMRDALAESYFNADQLDKAKPHIERLVQDMSSMHLFDSQQDRLLQLQDRLRKDYGSDD